MNLLFKGVKISEFHVRNFRGVFLQHLVMNKASIGSPWQFQLQRGAVALWPHTSVVGQRPPRATPRRCGSLDGYKAWAAATEWARPGGFIGLTVPVVDFSILRLTEQKESKKHTEKRKLWKLVLIIVDMCFFLKFRIKWRNHWNVDNEQTPEYVFELLVISGARCISACP